LCPQNQLLGVAAPLSVHAAPGQRLGRRGAMLPGREGQCSREERGNPPGSKASPSPEETGFVPGYFPRRGCCPGARKRGAHSLRRMDSHHREPERPGKAGAACTFLKGGNLHSVFTPLNHCQRVGVQFRGSGLSFHPRQGDSSSCRGSCSSELLSSRLPAVTGPSSKTGRE